MCFNYAFLYTYSCHEKWESAAYSLFVWDSRNVRGLSYVMLEFIQLYQELFCGEIYPS